MPNSINVLHLISASTWRGGENQVRILAEHSAKHQVISHVAAPANSLARQRCKEMPFCPLPSGRPYDPRNWFAIAKYAKKHSIDIFDAHSSHAHAMILAMSVLLGDRTPIVVHRRVDYPPKSGLANHWKYHHPKIRGYVAISEFIAKVMIEYGIPASVVHIARSAIQPKALPEKNSAQETWRAMHNLSANVPIVACVAALTDQKDHRTLINACAKLTETRWHLFLAGDGERRSDLESLVRDLGLKERVTFLGFIADPGLLLAAADIFAISSQDEGLGTAIQEAIYAGCDIVATDAGGIPEMVTDSVSGWIAPRRNSDIFAEKLAKSLANRGSAQARNQVARQHLDAYFSVAAMVEGNCRVYQKLVSAPGSR